MHFDVCVGDHEKWNKILTNSYITVGKRFKNIELLPSSTTGIVLTIIFFATNVCHINQVNAQETPKYSIDTTYRRQEMN